MRLTSVAPKTLALAFVLAFAVGSASLFAQNPPAQQTPPPAAQQAAPAKANLTFEGDLGELLCFVKPDKTADFETLMARFKEGLTKLDTPETKQQLSSLKIFKAPLGEKATVATYVLVADPPVKGAEYWFLSVLYKAFPTEAQAFADKWADVKGAVPQPVQKLDLTAVK